MEKGFFSKMSFMEFAIFVFFLIESNFDWNQSQLLHWGAVALLLVAYAFKDGGTLDFGFRDFSWWFLGVIVMSLISCVYSINVGNSIEMLKTLIIMFIAFFAVRNYITDEYRISRILILYIFAVFVNMVYVLTNIDMDLIGEVQLGVEAIEGWNGNSIGLMASSAGVLCVFTLLKSKGVLNKVIYLGITAFFAYVFLYTGSRKAIILFVVCLIIMLFMSSPQKMIRNTVFTVLLLYGTYMLVMNVESLYNVLGIRLEGLFAGFIGEGEVDSSTLMRQEYIENGWKWIKESPVIGYGLDGYRSLNGPETGRYTYSHNNFVEMAINWGIIGFAYYYSAYLIIVKKFFKCLKNNLLAVTVFALFVGNLFMHYGMVAYYEIWQNLLLCIGFAIVSIKNNEKVEEGKKDVKKAY